MTAPWRPTLRQLFGFSLLGLLVGMGLLFTLVFHGSQTTILQSSERYRELASRIVADRVATYLRQAPLAAMDFEELIRHGLVDPMKPDSVEKGLFGLLLANPNISEATLTYADSRAYGPQGDGKADPRLSGQVAVLRATQGDGFVRKRTWFDGTRFVSETEPLTQEAMAAPFVAARAVPSVDPTTHPTFQGAVDVPDHLYGTLISTDLHWSQIDDALPEAQRRVELSVQKSVEFPPGHFVGVLRIGLMKKQIDGAVLLHITQPGEADPHLIFLCDNEGRLITGFGAKDRVAVSGDDLRIPPENVPPVVARALQEPALGAVGDSRAEAAAAFPWEGHVWLCSFTSLPQTQGWIVGIVVPQDYYLGPLVETRDEVVGTSLGLMALLVIAGGLVLRSVARAQALIRGETSRMNEFQFAPSRHRSSLRDVDEVLDGLERAKTAMRAMSKYVPVNLVRQLYRGGREPSLGGQPCELSVLFTDIKDFTAISERLATDKLAEVLGCYLETMAAIVQNEKGTIDKFIGDAVMAFWNAPEPVAGHEVLACRAALRCREASLTACTGAGPAAPHFETRFGLHRTVASVGHFGAPDRFNYTAIGDGINLASRLEGLNKFYGTSIIASETIHGAAQGRFVFRLLDRVAVKGKMRGITIYELVAEKAAGGARAAKFDRYEEAFALYEQGEFAAALRIAETQPEDGPSRFLARRCREYVAHPPAEWNGVHSFDAK